MRGRPKGDLGVTAVEVVVVVVILALVAVVVGSVVGSIRARGASGINLEVRP